MVQDEVVTKTKIQKSKCQLRREGARDTDCYVNRPSKKKNTKIKISKKPSVRYFKTL